MYQAALLAAATHGGELPPDPRDSVDDWLNAGEVPDGPDKELRLALGV